MHDYMAKCVNSKLCVINMLFFWLTALNVVSIFISKSHNFIFLIFFFKLLNNH